MINLNNSLDTASSGCLILVEDKEILVRDCTAQLTEWFFDQQGSPQPTTSQPERFIAKDLTHAEMVEKADKKGSTYKNASFLKYIHLDEKMHPFLSKDSPDYQRKALVHRNLPGLVQSSKLEKYEGWTLSNSISCLLDFLNDHSLEFGLLFFEEKMQEALYQARVIDWSMGEYLVEPMEEIAEHNAEKVKNLLTGEEMIIPGYWHSKTGVHAIFYKITKEENDTYTLTVVNTGAGNDYHCTDSNKYSPGHRTIDIPLRKLDKAFFQRLNYISSGQMEKVETYLTIYDQVICPLGNPEGVYEYEYFGRQKSGVCTWRVLMGLVLLECGYEKYKEFSYEVKVCGLGEFREWKNKLEIDLKEKGLGPNMETGENQALFTLAQRRLGKRFTKDKRTNTDESYKLVFLLN